MTLDTALLFIILAIVFLMWQRGIDWGSIGRRWRLWKHRWWHNRRRNQRHKLNRRGQK